jgi:hypothetical protein
VRFLLEAVESGIDRAAERSQRTMDAASRADRRLLHDVTIVSSIALLMMSMKILKVLPGIAFASGHKTLILIPLYILAAQLTYSRFGATTAGTIMGLIAYLNGDGRYGVFDILKHVVPGLATDLLWPVFRRLPRKIWIYSALGMLISICRLSTEIALAALLGARWEVYLFLAPRVISNLLAGTLSGAVTYVLLPAFRTLEPEWLDTPPRVTPATPEAVDLRPPSGTNAVPSTTSSQPDNHPAPVGRGGCNGEGG